MEAENKIVSHVNERVQDWETGMSQFFGLWNEWAASYSMQFTDKDPRPAGISKNVVAETPRAVNTLASTITRMQTASDPPFELRPKAGVPITEEQIYYMEQALADNLVNVEYKRHLNKGNRGMCLFGTQVWEMPLASFPPAAPSPIWEGTALKSLSLLQCAFDTSVYDMRDSNFLAPVVRIGSHALRDLANSNDGVWDREKIEKAIDEKSKDNQENHAQSQIEQRRQRSGYNELKGKNHKLVLYCGRVTKEIIETPEFQQMWNGFGRQDNPLFVDIVCGVLDGKYLVRFHPAPYGSWRFSYVIGQYIEFELESMGFGVGKLGGSIQKDINKITRLANDVGKFDLFSMMLAGRNSGLKSNYMNIFPFSVVPCDDATQVVPLKPNVESIGQSLNLLKQMIEDFRGVTHATSTLQAVLTGATATESSLAQEQGLRAISIIAEINADSVCRPYYRAVIRNMIDQNPYDANFVPVDVIPKTTTDKDAKPEYSKKLLEFLNLVTSIRNVIPIDFNPMPILEYFARSVGINPRELSRPRPQVDRLMDVMRRINNNGQGKEAMAVEGEVAGSGLPDGNVSEVPAQIPNSPNQEAA